jgi:hypothetical protein
MKSSSKVLILCIAMSVPSFSVASASPGIVGDFVSVSRQIPSTGFILGPFEYTAQAGPADTVSLSGGNNLYLNVEDNSLQFSFGPSGGFGGPFLPLEHFILFQDLSPTAPIISGLTYQTDLPGFEASNISFTAHSVTVGEGGIQYSGGQYLTVNLQFEAVPEPSSFPLVVLGTVVLMAVRRRTASRMRG